MGNHGRACRTRLALCAGLLLGAAAARAAQGPAAPFDDILQELAGRIAGALSGGAAVDLTLEASAAADPLLHGALATRLQQRGVRVSSAGPGVVPVRFSCTANLRSRVCVAHVQLDPPRVIMLTRPLDAPLLVNREVTPSLALTPFWSQRERMLDAVVQGDRLFVLEATSVTWYRRVRDDWERVETMAIPAGGVMPRDLRGRLLVDDQRLAAFLPGVTCTGTIVPIVARCAERQQPWPIGIDNTGMDASRNHFSTPEGTAFLSAAPVGAGADGRWLVLDRDGAVHLLDDARRQTATGVAAGEDVATLTGACAREPYVMVVSRASDVADGDVLRMFQAAGRRLVPVASPRMVAGTVTAVWSGADREAATVIARAGNGRYEAFQASIACGG